MVSLSLWKAALLEACICWLWTPATDTELSKHTWGLVPVVLSHRCLEAALLFLQALRNLTCWAMFFSLPFSVSQMPGIH